MPTAYQNDRSRLGDGAAMRRWIIAAAAHSCWLDAARATRASDLRGPVAAEQLTPNVFKIRSRDTTTVQDVLLKAAETAKGAGGTHFRLISSSDASRQVDPTNPGGVSSALTPSARVLLPAPLRSSRVRTFYIRVLQFAPARFQGDFSGRRNHRICGPSLQAGLSNRMRVKLKQSGA